MLPEDAYLPETGQIQQMQLMDNERSLDKSAEVEELANPGLPLFCSAQQRLCLCGIFTLNSPATEARGVLGSCAMLGQGGLGRQCVPLT